MEAELAPSAPGDAEEGFPGTGSGGWPVLWARCRLLDQRHQADLREEALLQQQLDSLQDLALLLDQKTRRARAILAGGTAACALPGGASPAGKSVALASASSSPAASSPVAASPSSGPGAPVPTPTPTSSASSRRRKLTSARGEEPGRRQTSAPAAPSGTAGGSHPQAPLTLPASVTGLPLRPLGHSLAGGRALGELVNLIRANPACLAYVCVTSSLENPFPASTATGAASANPGGAGPSALLQLAAAVAPVHASQAGQPESPRVSPCSEDSAGDLASGQPPIHAGEDELTHFTDLLVYSLFPELGSQPQLQAAAWRQLLDQVLAQELQRGFVGLPHQVSSSSPSLPPLNRSRTPSVVANPVPASSGSPLPTAGAMGRRVSSASPTPGSGSTSAAASEDEADACAGMTPRASAAACSQFKSALSFLFGPQPQASRPYRVRLAAGTLRRLGLDPVARAFAGPMRQLLAHQRSLDLQHQPQDQQAPEPPSNPIDGAEKRALRSRAHHQPSGANPRVGDVDSQLDSTNPASDHENGCNDSAAAVAGSPSVPAESQGAKPLAATVAASPRGLVRRFQNWRLGRRNRKDSQNNSHSLAHEAGGVPSVDDTQPPTLPRPSSVSERREDMDEDAHHGDTFGSGVEPPPAYSSSSSGDEAEDSDGEACPTAASVSPSPTSPLASPSSSSSTSPALGVSSATHAPGGLLEAVCDSFVQALVDLNARWSPEVRRLLGVILRFARQHWPASHSRDRVPLVSGLIWGWLVMQALEQPFVHGVYADAALRKHQWHNIRVLVSLLNRVVLGSGFRPGTLLAASLNPCVERLHAGVSASFARLAEACEGLADQEIQEFQQCGRGLTSLPSSRTDPRSHPQAPAAPLHPNLGLSVLQLWLLQKFVCRAAQFARAELASLGRVLAASPPPSPTPATTASVMADPTRPHTSGVSPPLGFDPARFVQMLEFIATPLARAAGYGHLSAVGPADVSLQHMVFRVDGRLLGRHLAPGAAGGMPPGLARQLGVLPVAADSGSCGSLECGAGMCAEGNADGGTRPWPAAEPPADDFGSEAGGADTFADAPASGESLLNRLLPMATALLRASPADLGPAPCCPPPSVAASSAAASNSASAMSAPPSSSHPGAASQGDLPRQAKDSLLRSLLRTLLVVPPETVLPPQGSSHASDSRWDSFDNSSPPSLEGYSGLLGGGHLLGAARPQLPESDELRALVRRGIRRLTHEYALAFPRQDFEDEEGCGTTGSCEWGLSEQLVLLRDLDRRLGLLPKNPEQAEHGCSNHDSACPRAQRGFEADPGVSLASGASAQSRRLGDPGAAEDGSPLSLEAYRQALERAAAHLWSGHCRRMDARRSAYARRIARAQDQAQRALDEWRRWNAVVFRGRVLGAALRTEVPCRVQLPGQVAQAARTGGGGTLEFACHNVESFVQEWQSFWRLCPEVAANSRSPIPQSLLRTFLEQAQRQLELLPSFRAILLIQAEAEQLVDAPLRVLHRSFGGRCVITPQLQPSGSDLRDDSALGTAAVTLFSGIELRCCGGDGESLDGGDYVGDSDAASEAGWTDVAAQSSQTTAASALALAERAPDQAWKAASRRVFEVLELYLYARLHESMLPPPDSPEHAADLRFAAKLDLLAARGGQVSPEQLGLGHLPMDPELWRHPVAAIRDLETLHSPRQKLQSLVSCMKWLAQLLSLNAEDGCDADTSLSALIYVLLEARPVRPCSQLAFIERFSPPGVLTGESGFCLITANSAVRYISDLLVPGGGPDASC